MQPAAPAPGPASAVTPLLPGRQPRSGPRPHDTPAPSAFALGAVGMVDFSLPDGGHGSSCLPLVDAGAPVPVDDAPAPVPGDEPLPGYRLVERLGGGGGGEVWRCSAPGGLPKAIKFVRSRRVGLDLDDSATRQEVAAFEQVRAIRHPFVLGLDRFERRGPELLIVMELADRTLQDRLDECRRAGLAGVPAAELLPLLAEAGEALDLLAGLGLQHLDVKPANLFLVGGHAKVGDFGLVTPVGPRPGGDQEVGVTPLYAPPEVLRGEVAEASDQYSLALTAYELLTGSFPYPAASPGAVLLMHLTAAPDLTAVGGPQAAVFARALAKRPGDRFPSCREFAARLGESFSRRPAGVADVVRPSTVLVGATGGTCLPGRPAADPPHALVFTDRGEAEPGQCPVPAGKVVRAMIRHSLLPVTRVAPADATGQTDVTELFVRFPVRSGPDTLAVRLAAFSAANGLGLTAVDAGRAYLLTSTRPGGWFTRLLDRERPVEVVVSLPGVDAGADGTREVAVLARGCGGSAGRVDRARYAASLALIRRLRDELAEGDDRRRWTRYPIDAPVVIHPVGRFGRVGPGVPGQCLDLSQAGCSVRLSAAPASPVLYVRFPGHPTAPHVGVRCSTVRRLEVDDGVELGCVFTAESHPAPGPRAGTPPG